MISLGGRDGRKGMGLGFGGAAEMVEPELEEGEACSCQNDNDSTIDPDIALSYIDVKLRDVLGHLRKDFEGGVSAENLGPKFGGYGSFLHTYHYQRSPVWSRPRSPVRPAAVIEENVEDNVAIQGPRPLQVYHRRKKIRGDC